MPNAGEQRQQAALGLSRARLQVLGEQNQEQQAAAQAVDTFSSDTGSAEGQCHPRHRICCYPEGFPGVAIGLVLHSSLM